jgi:CRP/FNR family cyclic AMP-dependent transcriptional regulator
MTNPDAASAACEILVPNATKIYHYTRYGWWLVRLSLASASVGRVTTAMADVIGKIIAASNQTISLRSGDVLFREHDKPDGMYLVKHRRLGIFTGGMPLETVREGGLIGEMALVEENRLRSATVIAATRCELIFIDVERFLSLVANNPRFSIAVMQVMARRLRTMNSRVAGTRAS